MIVLLALMAVIFRLPQKAEAETIEASGFLQMYETKIPASRGEIYDRNGSKLVENSPCCALTLDYVNWKTSDQCRVIRRALELLDSAGITYEDSMPLSDAPYNYTVDSAKMRRFLRAYGLREDLTAVEAAETLYKACGMPDFSEKEKRRILGVIYDLFIADFAKTGTYTLAENLDRSFVADAAYASLEFPAIRVEMQSKRKTLTEYAAHVLGRTGKIPADEKENYVDYPLDAVVGLDGAEVAFENLLRSTDGLCVNGDTVVKRARSGADVYLTLDMEMQKTAEDSLRKNIESLRERGVSAEGGAAVMIDIKTNEILALASYPTFSINEFAENYVNYKNDNLKPLYNRAIAGTYAPGSTFKMVTAAAALENGVIDSHTEIECTGIYDVFAPNYVYRCWRYLDTGEGHGVQTVSEALMNSCNCFFYEVGRLTGIDNIENYAKLFGFGQKTGIELRGEARGTVAGRVERALSGGAWYPGDTLNAAIGQSDTLATPLQLANYMAALCSGRLGVPHIFLRAEYHGKTIKSAKPETIRTIGLSETTRAAILDGLLAVTQEGTAQTVFEGCGVDVLAKSGSAQADGGNANAIFVLAAPADDPQVAISVVIERGESGTNAARVAREILEKWMERQKIYA